MGDVLGWRKLLGVIAPSTNTVVQPDMERMRPAGVTNHFSRIYVEDPLALSNEDFIAGTTAIAENTLDAVRSVMTCKPDYLVLGMSAITFYGGVEGSRKWKRQVEELAGVGASTGAESVAAALHAYGAKTVSFVSPYYPVANAEVRNFLEESGFTVKRDVPLECRCWTDIAKVGPDRLREVIEELDGDDVDAIVQVGTNLSMVDLAAEYEAKLGKPVIAINTATYWHALRAQGIADRIEGMGRLLAEY
ncbi:arylmalonate decarboxylase [Novosphingobium sp. ST904]|uniref:maleate cis-trans isomerase family protein n=1 Tax=Novosphingobium sp. ST904 TaxID=1684385 RepID=UPI0006C8AECB|nr:arylmalonate decarboxylase [Novosphingobium sp. ST904]KPH58136.1 arylmalonate decarboxylase [Novosphingobium sp. ST904]TCM41393.1 maleate isomerase [Novosphingobium sp. ST904]